MTKLAHLGSIFITVVEGLVVGALVILELLSGYKSAVMQHLYFKKIHYLGTFYHQDHAIFHIIGLLVCACIMIIWLRCKHITDIVHYLAPFTALCCLLIFCYISPSIKELNIHAYLLISLESFVALETVRVFLRK